MEVTQSLLNELFEYRDGELYWKAPTANCIKIGDKAGTKDNTGYIRTRVKGKPYLNHRLIFLMLKGYLPAYLDHIDNDKTNNRIENLREATLSQNQHNRKLNKNNKSNCKGVHWAKALKKWQVIIWIEGKPKYFGIFEDKEQAVLVAKEARLKYHGDFANHG